MANFHKLILVKNDYKTLKNTHKGETLVFQFSYDSVIGDGSPNLRAFAMKQKHVKISDTAFVDLQNEPTVTAPVHLNDVRIQGDLQAEVKEIEKIKKASNDDPEDYQYFLFTPKQSSQNIVYTISVVPTTKSFTGKQVIDADPSPPASVI